VFGDHQYIKPFPTKARGHTNIADFTLELIHLNAECRNIVRIHRDNKTLPNLLCHLSCPQRVQWGSLVPFAVNTSGGHKEILTSND